MQKYKKIINNALHFLIELTDYGFKGKKNQKKKLHFKNKVYLCIDKYVEQKCLNKI